MSYMGLGSKKKKNESPYWTYFHPATDSFGSVFHPTSRTCKLRPYPIACDPQAKKKKKNKNKKNKKKGFA